VVTERESEKKRVEKRPRLREKRLRKHVRPGESQHEQDYHYST